MPGMTDVEEARALNTRFDVANRFSIGLFTTLPTSGQCTLLTAASQSSGVMTFTMAAVPATIVAGTIVSVIGCTPDGYNGTWTVTSVTATTVVATNPNVTGLGAGSVFGWMGVYGDPVPLTSISVASNVVTCGTATAHGYLTGMKVTVTGTSISGVNSGLVNLPITVTSSTSFTVALTTGNATGTTTALASAGYGAFAGQVHNGIEVSGNAYARLAINAGVTTDWNAAQTGAPTIKSGPSTTKGTWQFIAASGGNWGQIVGAGLIDTTDGVWAQFGILTTPQLVNNGNQFQFDTTFLMTLQLGDPADTFT